MPDADQKSSRNGFIFGLVAYSIWGFFPAYFKMLKHLDPLLVVSHRISWSIFFLFLIISFRRSFSELAETLRDRRALIYLFVTAILISTNWLVFIFAVKAGEVLQSSLGYFMTPLLSVLLGVLLLRERLNILQIASIVLAVAGVGIQVFAVGKLPIVALTLAATFGLYGFLRKIAPVESLTGLTIETGMLAPIALGFIIYSGSANGGHYVGTTTLDTLLLPLAGVVTAVPLLLFAAAAKRLRMTTIGFLQYITPSLHFLQAVFLYGEEFSGAHLASFCCIWVGLLLYSVDAVGKVKGNR